MRGTILIVDDSEALGRSLIRLLEVEGYRAHAVRTATEARTAVALLDPDVALIDLELPDAKGMDLLGELKQSYPDVQFIIITGHGSIRSAIETTRLGAADYLTKPFEADQLYKAIEHALAGFRRGEEVRRLRTAASSLALPEDGAIHSRSPAMRKVLDLADRAAKQDGIVLLLGESGTCKDHLCRWIHQHSRRADGPFFAINCAALARELAESELFGHEPGAFTGTRGRKRGLLELAEQGSLFLDEIGELDPMLQSKLLTFLDSRVFVRVGGEKPVSIDARIFAATNRDLEKEVDAGRFRKDLYYRLNVFPIELPPLRERLEDLPELAEEMLAQLTADVGVGHRVGLEPEALQALREYSWPGNIRELRNVLERALIVSSGGAIRRSDLSIEPMQGELCVRVSLSPGKSLHEVTRQVARELVTEALRRAKTRQEAAQLLGIWRWTPSFGPFSG